ncbi:methyltransferase family protein [Litoreibacter ponti]|uniref:Methyltransferase family protein n=1 Tax=Litoreibacter ponti TaxID=1510457 RepID=A0A2T6BIX5_9RHOB|nr:class I SAM-dependent methyltransferase [Litoreibacter ponti]PTX56007.1 methyltransferase family protein [Litoreibacter ponti]
MDHAEKLSAHYAHGGLLTAIRAGLEAQGIAPENASVEDLAPVDEFHIGGRTATAHLLGQLAIKRSDVILDIGCGLGGAARFVAKTYGARVVGLDLTAEYIETGQVLCDWVGLSERIELVHGSALSVPFEAGHFDGAYMMHVGMNIDDKRSLFAEISRVLKPGAKFGIYDIMQTNDDDLAYPVPWATTSETSWLARPDAYRTALESCGFSEVRENNRHAFAMEFFKKMKAANAGRDAPPPLGLHVLMQQSAPEKIANMVANLAADRIAPVEMLAVKEG